MNPQGQFQGVSQLPKPFNTQYLTILLTRNNPKYTISLFSVKPKRMDPLLCHTILQDVHLLPGLHCIFSRISMLGLSRLTTVNKI
jgi:hypothetical protein